MSEIPLVIPLPTLVLPDGSSSVSGTVVGVHWFQNILQRRIVSLLLTIFILSFSFLVSESFPLGANALSTGSSRVCCDATPFTALY
jgi:hypothetical protein